MGFEEIEEHPEMALDARSVEAMLARDEPAAARAKPGSGIRVDADPTCDFGRIERRLTD